MPSSRDQSSARSRAVHKQLGRTHKWRRSLDQYIWLQRKAGVPAADILNQARKSLGRYAKIRSVQVPPMSVLLLNSEVVSTWRYDADFVDKNTGEPKPLPLDGKFSFSSLLGRAGISASPRLVARRLARYGVVQQDRNGLLQLMVDQSVPKGEEFVPDRLGCAIVGVNSLLDTVRITVASKSKSSIPNRIQRIVWVEGLRPSELKEYEKLQRKTVAQIMAAHNAFFKRNPKRSARNRRLVGLQVNGVLLSDAFES